MAAPGEVIFEQELSAKRRIIRKDGVDCQNECETLSIAIDEAAGSSDSRSSCEKLWSNMVAGAEDVTKTKLPMIRKVPEKLRKKESSCFDPLVVSIGPYHHGKSELQEVERLKDSMVLQFIEKSNMQLTDRKMRFCLIYSEVEKISDAARKFYPEETTSKFVGEKFTWLMFVDGCFVLWFIHSFLNKHEVEHMKSHIAAFVRRDLMLLENQLPCIVLKVLMRFQENGGEKLINNFMKSIRFVSDTQDTCIPSTAEFLLNPWSGFTGLLKNIFRKETTNQSGQPQPVEHRPLHLLDLFLEEYIDTNALTKKPLKITHNGYSYPAANELGTLGIHFRLSAGKRFTDIKYKSRFAAGCLFLPRIIIDDTTKSLLLNLMAYEASPDARNDVCGLTSYICFMDSLIDQAEDVKKLRSKRIVFNLLGSDQQAADLINDIAKDQVPNPYAFILTKQGIEEHSKSKIRTWIAEVFHTHFSSPWTVIAFLAAAVALGLTVLQTYIAVLDHCEEKGKEKGSFFCA